MYRGEPQPGTDGALHPVPQAMTKRDRGLYLFQLHERLRPETSLEVGLAHGFSALYVFGAMLQGGAGHHLAIDPYQEAWFHGVGRLHATRLGLDGRFTLIEEPSATALARLGGEGRRVQLAFIDGDHKFDSVLVDFALTARLCDVGGVVVLDDLWMPSVRRAVSFLRRNREDFEEESTGSRTAAAFRRVGDDRRPWDHYRRF